MGKGRCSDRSLEDSMHGAQGQGTMPLSATASKTRADGAALPGPLFSRSSPRR
jgi:hypothetical protein